jgi:hypothetical protein
MYDPGCEAHVDMLGTQRLMPTMAGDSDIEEEPDMECEEVSVHKPLLR